MIKPCGHRILVKEEDISNVSEGGIELILDEKLERANQVRGHIHAVGSQAWKAFGPDHTGKPWAKVGDYVLFSRYAGKIVEDPFTEEEFKVLNDEDVIAVLEEKADA